MRDRIIHYSIAVIFGVLSILQYNREDPFLWLLIYGGVCLVALVKVFQYKVDFKPLITTFIVIYGLYALTYIPSVFDYLTGSDKGALFSLERSKLYVRETREFIGLMLSVAAFLYMHKTRIGAPRPI